MSYSRGAVTGASLRISGASRGALVPAPTENASLEPIPERDMVDASSLAARKQLARFIARNEKDSVHFSSPMLHVESVLAKASAQLPDTLEMKASVAIWALQVLSKDSVALASITSALLPAIFDRFSENRCEDVPSGVKALLGDASSWISNRCPAFSHSFYFEVCRSIEASLEDAERRSEALETMSTNKLAVAKRLISASTRQNLRVHFLAWRHAHRAAKIERFAAKVRERRLAQSSRRDKLALSFMSWRWAVEHGRGLFLQERLHDSAFLLDNTKNQFQMQCFRSDRYLHTVEELRSDLRDMRESRDTFRGEARALEKALRDHRIISRDEKNDIANVLLRSLSEWKHIATVSVTRRGVPQRLLQLEAAVSQLRAKKGLSATAPMAATYSSVPTDDTLDEDTRLSAIAEKTCLEWANLVLKESPLFSGSVLTNYREDFFSGEAFLLLLKEIFPDEIPLTPLQEPNLMRRLDKISELAASVGMCHFPQPSDLAEKSSDIVFMAVAELFMHHTRKLLEHVPEVTAPPTCLIRYDASMVKSALRDVSQGMSFILSSEREIHEDINRVRQMVQGVAQYASFLTRERLAGHPVALVDQKEVNRFCRFKPARFKDLEFKYKGSGVEWSEQMNRLRAVVRKAFPLLKRCFESYAGGGPLVAEPNFWRFIGDLGVVDRQTPRAAIERVFVVANREDDAVNDIYSDDEEDAENPITELIPIEFTECVIRIADQRSLGRTIDERVATFVNTVIKPLSSRRADTNRFRREIYDRPTQPIWAKYQKDLAKVFMYFARQSKAYIGQKPQTRFIGLTELVLICKDGGALQGGVDEGTIGMISRNVLGDDSNEIALHAFMECLAALAAFRVPNPFIPLDKKIDHVVSQLLATLRIKLRGAVTISDVRLVPLPLQRG